MGWSLELYIFGLYRSVKTGTVTWFYLFEDRCLRCEQRISTKSRKLFMDGKVWNMRWQRCVKPVDVNPVGVGEKL
jgi:hypothetical protein